MYTLQEYKRHREKWRLYTANSAVCLSLVPLVTFRGLIVPSADRRRETVACNCVQAMTTPSYEEQKKIAPRKESGLRNPEIFACGIWNPGLLENRSRNLDPTIDWNLGSKFYGQIIRYPVPGVLQNPRREI